MTTEAHKRQSHFEEWTRALELWNDAATRVREEVNRFEALKTQHVAEWEKLLKARELATKALEARRAALDEAMPRPTIQERDSV